MCLLLHYAGVPLSVVFLCVASLFGPLGVSVVVLVLVFRWCFYALLFH